ncbi:hypothetical protein [Salipiger sp.]|uniref:hypothetical protein n=1 Tax=Salipiger sp. TaxID=2078585 RepID=UPI003A979C0C
MSLLRTLTVISHRGLRYPVELFSPDTRFADAGAVYLYLASRSGGEAQVIYVGDAECLDRQIAADRRPGGLWHRAEAMGFDTIGALALARPEDRQTITRDFAMTWNPPCNDGHAGRGLGLFAPPFGSGRHDMAR